MAQQIDRSGTFRGTITNYGIRETESGAVAVSIAVGIEDVWHEGEWHDWREYDVEARGDMWIVKKDGSLIQRQMESLCTLAGWDGSFTSISHGTWEPSPVQITVSGEDYKGKTQYRIAWIDEYEKTPGQRKPPGNVDAGKAASLEARFGSQVRALTSTFKKPGAQAPAAPSAPASPTKRPSKAPSRDVQKINDELADANPKRENTASEAEAPFDRF